MFIYEEGYDALETNREWSGCKMRIIKINPTHFIENEYFPGVFIRKTYNNGYDEYQLIISEQSPWFNVFMLWGYNYDLWTQDTTEDSIVWRFYQGISRFQQYIERNR